MLTKTGLKSVVGQHCSSNEAHPTFGHANANLTLHYSFLQKLILKTAINTEKFALHFGMALPLIVQTFQQNFLAFSHLIQAKQYCLKLLTTIKKLVSKKCSILLYERGS